MGYEERKYSETHWVSTKVLGMDHKQAVSTGFGRLFKYITGTNEGGVKVPMTAPVTTKVEHGAGPNCESTFTVSFLLGKDFQQAPPTPTDTTVFTQTLPPFTCYARQFGGFTDNETWLSNAKELGESVPKEPEFHTDFYFTAGYDSPFKLFNRRNEVWFILKDKDNS